MNIKSALPGNDVGYKKERQKHARAQEHVCAPVHKYIESSTIKKKKVNRDVDWGGCAGTLLVAVSKQQVTQTKQLGES